MKNCRNLVLAIFLLMVLAGCASHYSPENIADPYGFFSGIWHGAIAVLTITVNIISWVLSLAGISFFQDIQTSFFYLNNVIPCQITFLNNIIILPPDYHFYREINQTDRKIINLTYTVKFERDEPPLFINNKWMVAENTI
jgi:hypothetical protein